MTHQNRGDSETNPKVMKEIDDVLPRHELDDQLFKMQGQRLNCGRDLIDARWEQARRDDPASRIAAGQLSEQLSHTASTGSGGRRAKGMTRSVACAPNLGRNESFSTNQSPVRERPF